MAWPVNVGKQTNFGSGPLSVKLLSVLLLVSSFISFIYLWVTINRQTWFDSDILRHFEDNIEFYFKGSYNKQTRGHLI